MRMNLKVFDSLESTNKYCELLDPSTVEEFTVICAKQQTAGIGQRGNHWHSESGKNLTFSLILKPTFLSVADQYQLTKVIALGITDCLRLFLPSHSDIKIKWPNDIYIGNKKVCGILTSNKIQHNSLSYSIVGIGLNVNQTLFPDWIPNPTSLQLVLGSELPLLQVLNSAVECISRRYNQLALCPTQPNPAIDNDYLSQLLQLGIQASYLFHDSPVKATIQGVNRFGHLELTTDSGVHLTCQLKELKYLF